MQKGYNIIKLTQLHYATRKGIICKEKGGRMRFYDALQKAAADSGMSFTNVSEKIGKNRNYVANNVNRGSDPATSNAAAMVEACGWSLCVMPSGSVPDDAIVIDPPMDDENAERRALERRRDKLRRDLAKTEELLG